MRLDHIFVIGKREYFTRVKTKGFWIATVALPLFMSAMIVGPAYLINKVEAHQRLAIVDATGQGLGQQVEVELANAPAKRTGRGSGPASVRFEPRLVPPRPDTAALRQELDTMVRTKQIDAWLWLDGKELAANHFEYHAESVSNVFTQISLSNTVSKVVRDWRLRTAGYDSAKIALLTAQLEPETVHISATGSEAQEGEGALFLAIALFFMLYLTLIIYGQQVMQGVIEEKSSRIIEVLASAVKPTELMFGKLGGICAVALTQLAIWVGTAFVLTSPGLVAASALAGGKMPHLSPVVVVLVFLLFLLGFAIYSTIYAMVGASFNSVQEAQQVAGIVILPVIAPVLFLYPVINDPDSTLAVVTSLFPFFTPLVMTLRIATKMPPWWQIGLAYALGICAVGVMVWICSRIYRVGILMYGKKPTIQEIWRWVRYA